MWAPALGRQTQQADNKSQKGDGLACSHRSMLGSHHSERLSDPVWLRQVAPLVEGQSLCKPSRPFPIQSPRRLRKIYAAAVLSVPFDTLERHVLVSLLALYYGNLPDTPFISAAHWRLSKLSAQTY